MLQRPVLKERKFEYILALVVFLAVFVMCCFTPLLVDDYTYSYNVATGERIASVGELVQSLTELRNLHNGRVVAHCLVQLVLLMPKMVFNVLNAFHALLLMYLGSHFYRKGNSNEKTVFMFFYAVLIWNYMPAFGQTFIWLDGAFNYSWGLSFMCLFIWPFAAEYMGKGGKFGVWKTLLFCLVSFVAGAYSENGSIAIIFMAFCFVLLILSDRRKAPLHLLLGLAIALCGFAFLMRFG